MPNRKTIIKRSILCKIISCILLLIVSAVCLYSCGDVKKNIKKDVEKHSMIYGLTIDDAWYDPDESAEPTRMTVPFRAL